MQTKLVQIRRLLLRYPLRYPSYTEPEPEQAQLYDFFDLVLQFTNDGYNASLRDAVMDSANSLIARMIEETETQEEA